MVHLNDDRYKILEKSMKKLGYDKSSLIEILHTTQDTFGYLEKETLKLIARRLKLPFSKVYGVATFYHFFTLELNGKHTALVCMGTACYVKGAKDILQKLEEKFDIKVGETTKDGLLTLLSARCIGTCSLAPIAIYDTKTLDNVTIEIAIEKIEELIND
jgi:bidirectional [NiFe] hydrogenase diaphorase subunit